MAAPRKRSDPAPLPGAGLGCIAYEAYVAAVGGRSVKGDALPAWDDQDPRIAAAWCAVGQAVIAATIARKD